MATSNNKLKTIKQKVLSEKSFIIKNYVS